TWSEDGEELAAGSIKNRPRGGATTRLRAAVGSNPSARAGTVPRAGPSGEAAPVTTTQLENWEVSLVGLVAVAVTNRSGSTPTPRTSVKAAMPLASVVTVAVPKNCSTSPKPDGLQTVLLKNSRLKVVAGVLVRVPTMVVLLPSEVAA